MIEVEKGIEPGDTVFIFQGIISNIRSQPRIVDWFGIHDNGAISPFKKLVEECALNEDLRNTQSDIEHILLDLNDPVDQAKIHMLDLRSKRGEGDMGKELRNEVRRLRIWQKAARKFVEEKYQRKAGKHGLRKDETEKKERELNEIDQHMETFNSWVDQSLRTSTLPYVRLVCVLRRKK